MPSELLIAIIAGLVGMLGWGLADLFAKKTIDVVGDTASLAWGHLFGTIGFLIIFLLRVITNKDAIHLPASSGAWVLVAGFGILQAVIYLLVYRGFGKGQVAVLNPLFASFSGITAVLSIVVFGELVTGHIILALGTIFIGVLFMNIDPTAFIQRRLSFTKVPGFKEIIIATVLAACWTLFWDRIVGDKDGLTYAFLMYLFMTIAIFFYVKIKNIQLRVVTPTMWKFLVFIGLCETAAYLAITTGYSLTTKTSVIALLSGAFSLPTILFARAFLKERVTPLQAIGSIIIITGIILLAVV